MELTPRQSQIVTLLLDGYTQKEVAQLLGLSYHTVAEYMLSARRKYGLPHTNALMAKFVGRYHADVTPVTE